MAIVLYFADKKDNIQESWVIKSQCITHTFKMKNDQT